MHEGVRSAGRDRFDLENRAVGHQLCVFGERCRLGEPRAVGEHSTDLAQHPDAEDDERQPGTAVTAESWGCGGHDKAR